MGSAGRWVLAGLLTVGALAALAAGAESAWLAGYPQLADAIGVSRLAVCWLVVVPAWKSLDGVRHRVWPPLGRTALATLLVVAVLT